VRSKGVGVYFVSQNPLDIPDEVLGQLGNRVQHALRAFTPRDQKAVKAAATTFRTNPAINVETAITELGVGEALVSTLEDKGTPSIVERAFVVPPHSQIGPITPEQRKAIITGSVLFGHYENAIDRDSAYEILTVRAKQKGQEAADAAEQKELEKHTAVLAKEQAAAEKQAARAQRAAGGRSRQSDDMMEAVMKSTARAAGSQLGRSITRGILGSIFGGRK
jgi:DNA helicase HerA-like ATPase